jgi:hypothetical protein
MNPKRYRKMMRLSVMLAAVISRAAWAQTYGVEGDSYVSSVSPTLNFGTLGTLNVGSGGTALVQIDLTRLTA